jgi:hypothetical protein
MQYVVYCDESRHDGGSGSRYMAIGSLWLPRDRKQAVTEALRRVFRETKLGAELKWSKVSNARLDAYKRIVDFFFEEGALRFRAVVVDHAQFDPARLHGGDRELGFYRFYYELLANWLGPGHEYLILLDFKQNKGADRYTTLRTALERRTKGTSWITDLTVIDSRETPLAQLCDILTGSVAAAWCGYPGTGGAKKQIGDYISRRLGVATMKALTASSEDAKVNLSEIALR